MEQKSSKFNEVQVVDERLTCNFKKSATGSIIVLLFRCCTQKNQEFRRGRVDRPTFRICKTCGDMKMTATTPFVLKLLKTILLSTACLAAVLAQSPAIAQSEQEAADSQFVEEVVVTGIRRSLELAANIKRNSDAIVDALAAQDIGLFSDNNIGEALGRVPGVLVERDAGDDNRRTPQRNTHAYRATSWRRWRYSERRQDCREWCKNPLNTMKYRSLLNG